MARLNRDGDPAAAHMAAVLPRFFAGSSADALRNIAACCR
jgi:hypothetical protein